MAKRAALLLVFVIVFLPMGFGDIKKTTDAPAFYFTRLQYRSPYRGFGGFGRGGSWMTDAWNADHKYMRGNQRMTNIQVSPEPNPVASIDPELFKYPYIPLID